MLRGIVMFFAIFESLRPYMAEPYITECFCPQHDIIRALMMRLAAGCTKPYGWLAPGCHPCADVYVADIIISILARERINEYMAVLRDPATFLGCLPRDCIGLILPRLSSDGMFAGYHHSFASDGMFSGSGAEPRHHSFASDGIFAGSGAEPLYHRFLGDPRYGYIAYNSSIRFENNRLVDLLYCRNGECYHLTRSFLDTGGSAEYPVTRGYIHGMYTMSQHGVVQYRSYDFMNIGLAIEFASGTVICFNVFNRDLKFETTGTFTDKLRRWCFTKML